MKNWKITYFMVLRVLSESTSTILSARVDKNPIQNLPGGTAEGNRRSSSHSKGHAVLVIANYDFDGAEDDDLSFKKGDVITVLMQLNKDWARGSLGHKEGMFPLNHVGPFRYGDLVIHDIAQEVWFRAAVAALRKRWLLRFGSMGEIRFGLFKERQIKWNRVSQTHAAKLEALAELLKRDSERSTTIGTYRTCLEETYRIGKRYSGAGVYVGLSQDGDEVAVKRLPLSLYKEMDENEKKKLIERSITKEKYFAKYRHSEIVEGYGYLILDLCEQSLEEYVAFQSQDDLRKEAPRIIRQILEGLKALHCDPEQTILHRNLKPSNVLVDIHNNFLLSDFGFNQSTDRSWLAVECLAKIEVEESNTAGDLKRTINASYIPESDVQVVGMLFFYLLTKGRHPYGSTRVEQDYNIKNGHPIYLDQYLVDPVAKDLIGWILEKDPKDRPQINQCLEHPYICSTDDQFDLIIRVAKHVEKMTSHSNSSVVQQLSSDPMLPQLWLPQPNWNSAIDPAVINYVSEKRNYSSSVADLLRFIRSTEEHWGDRTPPPAVIAKVVQPKEYFLKLFPTLPVILHRITRTHAPGWIQDDDVYNAAYHLALKDGETINRRIPIMIVGQDRSGKTSLRRHLQGQQHNPCEPSTCGIEVDLVELTESNAEEPWVSKDVSKYTLTKRDVDMHVSKAAADHVTKRKSVPESSEADTAKFEEPVTKNQPKPIAIRATVAPLPPQPKEPLALPPKETIANIKSMVESPDDKPSSIMALLHDLAGQSVFFDTHHLFLKPRCPYIVVYDLERLFNDTAKQRFKPTCTDEDIELKNPLLATNLDIFLAWFNVLNKLGEILGQTSETSLPSFQIPPVLVALTKSDCFKGDLNKLKKIIKDILKKKEFKNVFVDPYIIDNTSSGKENEDDVRKLRKKASELMKEMLDKQRPVPISWEQFEAILTEKMVNERVPYILLEDALALGERCGVKDVKAALNFLHHQGVILHNVGSPVVVLNPVWLMNIFAEIITVPQEDIPIDASHRARLEEGILMEEYLTKMTTREHGEVVKKLLLEFGLICPWQHAEGPAFVVPSLTPVMQKGDEVLEVLAESPIPPLYLHSRQGHMLPGFFTRFLGLIINKNSTLLCCQPRLYYNYAMLVFDCDKIEFDVYLVEQLVGIKIGVVPRSKVTDEKFIPFVKYLKQSIIECTDNLKKKEGLYRNIDVDLKVKCTVCFGYQTTCVLHRKESCNHDSCGHYWRLHELQQCTKDPVCPSSDVKRKIFPLAPLLQWLNSGRTYTDYQSTPKTSHEDYHLFMERHISELHYQKRDEICKKLNVMVKFGGGFTTLAGHFNMPKDDLNVVGQNENPTRSVLEWAEKDSKNKMKILRDNLEKMERFDCIDILLRKGQKVILPFMERNISELDLLAQEKLCQKLDVENFFVGNYVHLAEKFAMPNVTLDLICQESNPTECVLHWAGRKRENTIGKLYDILKNMNRGDCTNVLDEALKKDSH